MIPWGVLLVIAGFHAWGSATAFEERRCPECFGESTAVCRARVESLVIGTAARGDAVDWPGDAADAGSQESLSAFEVVLRLSEDGRVFSGPLKVSGLALPETLPLPGTTGWLLVKAAGSNQKKGEWTPACAFPSGFFPEDSASGEVSMGLGTGLTLPGEKVREMLNDLPTLRTGLDRSWQAKVMNVEPKEQIARLWLSGVAPREASTSFARDVTRGAMTDQRARWLPEAGDDTKSCVATLLEVAWPLLYPEDKAELAEELIAELDRYPSLLAPESLRFLLGDGIVHVSDLNRRESLCRALFKSHVVSTGEGEITRRVFNRFGEAEPWLPVGWDEALNRVILDIARGECCRELLGGAGDLVVLFRCLSRGGTQEGRQILLEIAAGGMLPAGIFLSDSRELEKVVGEARKLAEVNPVPERVEGATAP